jgi:hypothetical protein
MTCPPRLAKVAAPLAAALAGVLWFAWNGGLQAVAPGRIDFIMKGGDWAQHWLGWAFYRREALGFPLGSLHSLPFPVGTNTGYTDSNPWLALLLRPFLRGGEEAPQYIGLWLLGCFALQGFFGARVASRLVPGRTAAALGGVLFALSPVLLLRMGHDTLCAHFLLLAMLERHLAPMPDARGARRSLAFGAALGFVAAGIHPYLAAQVFALQVALVARAGLVERQVGWLVALSVLAGSFGVVFGALWAIGVLSTPAVMAAHGFGRFGADLLALVNPGSGSRLLPALPLELSGQREGYAWVGLGAALCLAGALAAAARREVRGRLAAAPWKRIAPLAVAVSVMAFFALSSEVSVAGHPVASLDRFYKDFMTFTGPFQASGRFIWPLHLSAIALAIALLGRVLAGRPRATALFLAAAVLVQLADLSPRDAPRFEATGWPRRSDPAWALAPVRHPHLSLYPAQIYAAGKACAQTPPEYGLDRWLPFAELAARLGMTFDSAYLARMDADAAYAYCREQRETIESGRIDPATVYLVWPPLLPVFARAGATCGRIGDDDVCVASAADDPFAAKLGGR